MIDIGSKSRARDSNDLLGPPSLENKAHRYDHNGRVVRTAEGEGGEDLPLDEGIACARHEEDEDGEETEVAQAAPQIAAHIVDGGHRGGRGRRRRQSIALAVDAEAEERRGGGGGGTA